MTHGPTRMREWASVDGAALARLEGVVFDVDDTVTRDGRLERVAFEAMWSLAGAGLSLLAVTGRPLGWADVIARHWPVRLAVGENGAGWAWSDGGTLRDDTFHSPQECRAQQRALERIRLRVAEQMPEARLAADQRARRCDLAYDVGDRAEMPPADVDRLVSIIEAEGMRCPVSSVHAHAVAGDWDKARGVVRAARQVLGLDLDRDRERWLFVGDSGNDAEAFAWFPLSVGVSNVRPHLSRLTVPPAFVTLADRGQGFAEVAAAVLAARAGRV